MSAPMTLEEAVRVFDELRATDRGMNLTLTTHETDALYALRAHAEAIHAACLAVCRDNSPTVLGGDFDPDLGRYLCLNENGDELIDTDDPAEVVRALADLWGQVSEKLDAMQAERDALRLRVAALEPDEYIAMARVSRALLPSLQEWSIPVQVKVTGEQNGVVDLVFRDTPAVEIRSLQARVAALEATVARVEAVRDDPPLAVIDAALAAYDEYGAFGNVVRTVLTRALAEGGTA